MFCAHVDRQTHRIIPKIDYRIRLWQPKYARLSKGIAVDSGIQLQDQKLQVWQSNWDHKRVGLIGAPPELFCQPIRIDLLQRVTEYERSITRKWCNPAKDRSQVRGSGRKPFRQKGTGRARQGSIRSPINRGGGKAHGPVKRSFGISIQKKLKRLGLKIALSAKFYEDQITFIDSTELETHKTGELAKKIKALVGKESFLLVDRPGNTSKNFLQASNNFPYVKVIKPSDLSVVEIMRKGHVILTPEGLEDLELWLSTHPLHRLEWKARTNKIRLQRDSDRRIRNRRKHQERREKRERRREILKSKKSRKIEEKRSIRVTRRQMTWLNPMGESAPQVTESHVEA